MRTSLIIAAVGLLGVTGCAQNRSCWHTDTPVDRGCTDLRSCAVSPTSTKVIPSPRDTTQRTSSSITAPSGTETTFATSRDVLTPTPPRPVMPRVPVEVPEANTTVAPSTLRPAAPLMREPTRVDPVPAPTEKLVLVPDPIPAARAPGHVEPEPLPEPRLPARSIDPSPQRPKLPDVPIEDPETGESLEPELSRAAAEDPQPMSVIRAAAVAPIAVAPVAVAPVAVAPAAVAPVAVAPVAAAPFPVTSIAQKVAAAVPAVAKNEASASAPRPVAPTAAPKAAVPAASVELIGTIESWRKTRRLRYAGVDITDANGGRVTLLGGGAIERLEDNQRVRVRGFLTPAPDRATAPTFHVESLEVLDGNQRATE